MSFYVFFAALAHAQLRGFKYPRMRRMHLPTLSFGRIARKARAQRERAPVPIKCMMLYPLRVLEKLANQENYLPREGAKHSKPLVSQSVAPAITCPQTMTRPRCLPPQPAPPNTTHPPQVGTSHNFSEPLRTSRHANRKGNGGQLRARHTHEPLPDACSMKLAAPACPLALLRRSLMRLTMVFFVCFKLLSSTANFW